MEQNDTAPDVGNKDGLDDQLARVICERFYLTTCKGWPDCGPIFIDDDEAVEQVRGLIATVLESLQPSEAEKHDSAVHAGEAANLYWQIFTDQTRERIMGLPTSEVFSLGYVTGRAQSSNNTLTGK